MNVVTEDKGKKIQHEDKNKPQKAYKQSHGWSKLPTKQPRVNIDNLHEGIFGGYC